MNKIAGGLNCVRYGQTSGLDVSGAVLSCSPFLHFEWAAGGALHEVKTQLIGAYNLDNALAAVAIGRYFGVEDTQICHALSSYVPQNNRSQLVQTESNTLIVDAYNANPTSMMAALLNFRQMEAEHKVAILGAMKELGEGSREEHQKVVDFLNECQFERVILVGPEFAGLSASFEHYENVKEVEAVLASSELTGCCILIKGSNSMKLSELSACL